MMCERNEESTQEPLAEHSSSFHQGEIWGGTRSSNAETRAVMPHRLRFHLVLIGAESALLYHGRD